MSVSSEKKSLLELLSVPGQDPVFVQKLIEEGADVNETSPYGFTPLMFAAIFNDNPTIVEMLLEHGADVEAESNEGMTPLMWALMAETPDHTGQDIGSSLEREEKRRAVAMQLIRKGSDVNAVCYSPRWLKWTPLLFATLQPDRNVSLISALVEQGAGVNPQTTDGVTPLMHSVFYGWSSDVPHELIQAGADVNASGGQEGRRGWTPLLYALASPYKSLPAVKELVLNQADVNVVLPNGSTPLLFAASLGDDPAFVELLLSAGANVQARDAGGSTALDVARAKNYRRVTNVLSKVFRPS